MKISVRRLEYLWHTFAFVLLSGAFVPLWRQMSLGDIDPIEGDPVQRLFLGLAYLGVGLLLFHPGRAWRVSRCGWLVWALMAWAVLSALWSVAPEITLRRSLAAMLGVLYGVLLAGRYRPEEVLRMLGAALAIVVVASLMAVVAIPEWAIMMRPAHHEGAWRGVMAHKNILGRTVGLAIIVFLVLRQEGSPGTKRVWTVWLVLSLGLLLASRSITSLFAVFLTLIAWVYIRGGLRLPSLLRPALFFGGLTVFIPAALAIVAYLENILSIFGKSTTLTGRLPLWNLLLPYAIDRLWLGYGYGAFWASMESPATTVVNLLPWNPTHAHNGYLDAWLDVGLLGLVITMFILLRLLWYGVSDVLKRRFVGMSYSITFLFALYLIAINVTYNLILEARLGTGLYWVIFVWLFMMRTCDAKHKGPNYGYSVGIS